MVHVRVAFVYDDQGYDINFCRVVRILIMGPRSPAKNKNKKTRTLQNEATCNIVFVFVVSARCLLCTQYHRDHDTKQHVYEWRSSFCSLRCATKTIEKTSDINFVYILRPLLTLVHEISKLLQMRYLYPLAISLPPGHKNMKIQMLSTILSDCGGAYLPSPQIAMDIIMFSMTWAVG